MQIINSPLRIVRQPSEAKIRTEVGETLRDAHPSLAETFDLRLNCGHTPDNVLMSKPKTTGYFWTCKFGHTWQESLSNKLHNNMPHWKRGDYAACPDCYENDKYLEVCSFCATETIRVPEDASVKITTTQFTSRCHRCTYSRVVNFLASFPVEERNTEWWSASNPHNIRAADDYNFYTWTCPKHGDFDTTVHAKGENKCPMCGPTFNVHGPNNMAGEAYESDWKPSNSKVEHRFGILLSQYGVPVLLDSKVNSIRVMGRLNTKVKSTSVYPDLIIPELKICVEYDPEWSHYNSVERDTRKDELLKQVGWEVIRVRIGSLSKINPHDVQASGPTIKAAREVAETIVKLRHNEPEMAVVLDGIRMELQSHPCKKAHSKTDEIPELFDFDL